jgi:hypothetical protein
LEEIATLGRVLSLNRTSWAFGDAEGDFAAGVRRAAVFWRWRAGRSFGLSAHGTTSYELLI